MERLTTKKVGELLIKYNDGEYRSPCFGCESINKCNPEKITCGFYKALEKLAEYEDLEEQNRLLKLPCAVGDTYYRIENDGANPPYISEWEVHTIEFCVNVRDNIGKTVFLAREEAEAALEELERGKVE